jgi:hypothetical protein
MILAAKDERPTMKTDRIRDDYAAWDAALLQALEDAIDHLQFIIFDEGMDTLIATTGSTEAGLREGVLHYERGLGQLFAVIRASGTLPDAVAWSTLKSELRRAALDAGVETTLRTALETGLYTAEREPLADQAVARAWLAPLLQLLHERGTIAGSPPAESDEERLYWALSALSDLEDHAAFHNAILARVPPNERANAIRAHAEHLLAQPRYDLILNASLLWLASASEGMASKG